MAAVNRNMFDACVATERPQGPSMLVLPLNLIAQIVGCVRIPLLPRNYGTWFENYKKADTISV